MLAKQNNLIKQTTCSDKCRFHSNGTLIILAIGQEIILSGKGKQKTEQFLALTIGVEY